VRIGFGTDLLGTLQIEQSREFLLRSEVQSPAEILRSATVTNVHILGKQDEIGTIRLGALADMIVVQGPGKLGPSPKSGSFHAHHRQGGSF
jgi:imidazolonepropionase-like amidohydrolase